MAGVAADAGVRLRPHTKTHKSPVLAKWQLEAGAVVSWVTLAWTAQTPAGTASAVSYRTGNTPTPDATWTAFTQVPGSGPISGTARYFQYAIDESTSVPGQTPSLNDITVGFSR